MSSEHYGNPEEVKNLGSLLLNIMKQIRDTNKEGLSILKKMNGTVNDSAYEKAEEIVQEVTKIIGAGIDYVIVVSQKLREYGDFLESMNQY